LQKDGAAEGNQPIVFQCFYLSKIDRAALKNMAITAQHCLELSGLIHYLKVDI
jgi:hypothetical protein